MYKCIMCIYVNMHVCICMCMCMYAYLCSSHWAICKLFESSEHILLFS